MCLGWGVGEGRITPSDLISHKYVGGTKMARALLIKMIAQGPPWRFNG